MGTEHIAILVILAFRLGLAVINHGQPRTDFDAWTELRLAAAVTYLLWAGVFWRKD